MNTKKYNDRWISWPAISVRIYGDRSGAFINAGGAFIGKLDRSDTAKLILELRKQLRGLRGQELSK